MIPRSAGQVSNDEENLVPVCGPLHDAITHTSAAQWEGRLRQWQREALERLA